MAEEKKLNAPRPGDKPDPEMLQQLEFLRELGMMEMIVDTGLDRKMKPQETKK